VETEKLGKKKKGAC